MIDIRIAGLIIRPRETSRVSTTANIGEVGALDFAVAVSEALCVSTYQKYGLQIVGLIPPKNIKGIIATAQIKDRAWRACRLIEATMAQTIATIKNPNAVNNRPAIIKIL